MTAPRHIIILGMGLMGCDIAAIFLNGGWHVTAVEPARDRWPAAQARVAQSITQLDGDPATWPELPSIGYCLPNTQAYILNNSLQPVREGEEGELALGGACLAQGYLNNADLTALKFKDIFLPNIGKKRIYLTGDIAKYLPNGELQFLGRRDDQVKISGFRVEPGEIEVVLSKQKGVLHAVVLAIGMETKKLVAYIVGDITNIQELKKNLSKQLPDYMMPSVFMHMADLPRTPNGKVDKLRLPRPEFRRPEMQVPYAAPTTP
jgi:acyl-CoA synthetase (AMP-forming)/AMP-acid ligase II